MIAAYYLYTPSVPALKYQFFFTLTLATMAISGPSEALMGIVWYIVVQFAPIRASIGPRAGEISHEICFIYETDFLHTNLKFACKIPFQPY